MSDQLVINTSTSEEVAQVVNEQRVNKKTATTFTEDNIVIGDTLNDVKDSGFAISAIPKLQGSFLDGELPEYVEADDEFKSSGKTVSDFLEPISGATEDNLTSFDASGGIEDSGISKDDIATFANTTFIDNSIATYNDLTGNFRGNILNVSDIPITDNTTVSDGSILVYDDANSVFKGSILNLDDIVSHDGSFVDGNLVSVSNATNRILEDTGLTPAQFQYHNAGMISDPSYLDNTDGTITIGSGTARFYDNTSFTGYIKEYTLTGNTFTLTDSLSQLNYIVADYNSGSPIFRLTNTLSEINGSTVLPVFTITRSGADLCRLVWNSYGLGYPEKAFKKDIELNRFGIKSGLALGETGTRNVTVASGNVYYGTKLASLDAVDTSGTDNICFFYHVAGVWTQSSITQYNNTQYDNGTGLQTLSNNKYAVNWVWRNVDEDKTTVCVVLGESNYSLAEAEESLQPEPPAVVSGVCVLIGRIIVQKNASTATLIERVSTDSFNTAGINNHNNLDSLELAGTGVTWGHIDDQSQTIYGDKTLNDDLVVSGNLTVNGDFVKHEVQEVLISDNMVSTNFGETTGVVTAGWSGLDVDRGSGDAYRFGFRESDDLFRIGTYTVTLDYGTLTGTFQFNEQVKQSTTNAVGWIQSDNGSNEMVLKIVSGTFNTTNVVTGQTSGATMTPTTVTINDDTVSVAAVQDSPVNGYFAKYNSSTNVFDTVTIASTDLSDTSNIVNYDDATKEFTGTGITSFASKVGIGTGTPLSIFSINNTTLNNFNINGQVNNSLEFFGVGTYSVLSYKQTAENINGLVISSATNDTNSSSDMTLSVREYDSSDFSTLTSKAFSFKRFTTELMTIIRNGNVGINEISPDYKLDVNGSFGFAPGSSVTPVDNGDVVFELTDNTTLTVKAKGSDGTVRSGTITLS